MSLKSLAPDLRCLTSMASTRCSKLLNLDDWGFTSQEQIRI